MDDPTTERLQRLPAVGAILQAPEVAPLVSSLGRSVVVRAARAVLEAARADIRRGAPTERAVPAAVALEATRLARPSLRRVINATGVVLHTNLGRAPLARAALEAAVEASRGYSTLELDLASGERGSRQDHVSALIAEVLGAEDGVAVNNCAAAVLLMLSALCRGGEVIISRGELVEIGGGFRVPDVLRESGAALVEVGTTNKVRLDDYRAALSERTRAILVVHRSNFALVGFTAQPTVAELAGLARERGLPLLADVGSGLLLPEDALGGWAREEPRPARWLAEGADVVAISGDKLLGGPQAGIVAGRRALIARMRSHPLARAVRADKLCLAALEATLRLYRDGREDEIPALALMRAPGAVVRSRAEALIAAAQGVALPLELRADEAVIGGGALPLASLPTWVVCVGRPRDRHLADALRAHDPPVITRVVDDRLAIDCRTVSDEEIATIAAALAAAGGATEQRGTP